MLFATVPDEFQLAIPLKLTAASTGLDAMNAGKILAAGSQWTLRWREMDSNPRSPAKIASAPR